MHDPFPDSLPPRPGADDISARSFRLLAGWQVAPIKPPRRCFLIPPPGQRRAPSPKETTSP